MPARLKDPNADRTCKVCGKTKPCTDFYRSGPGSNGRQGKCKRCRNQQERAKASFSRTTQRVNARGEVWCTVCSRYRSTDHFKRHPSPGRQHTWWWSCKDCTRDMDRIRYQAKKRFQPEVWKRDIDRRVAEKRKQSAREMSERRQFLVNALDTMLLRGFTKAEISRLSGVSAARFYEWGDPNRKPNRAVAERMAVVLDATSHLPIGEIPAERRQIPHPEIALISKRIAPDLARYPLRNSWASGKRSRKEAA